MNSIRALSRIAGILYLIVAVGGGFAEYVRTSVMVSGDATATAANVASHAALFKTAFVTDQVDFAAFLGVGVVMFAIFKSINPTIAVTMLVINAVSVAIQALDMLTHAGAFLTTDPQQVLFFLELHRHGYLIAQVYFGGYLLPLGYLVYRSGFLPKILGVILMIGAAGYVAGVIATYLSPSFESAPGIYLGLAGGLAEVLFLLWLLIVGAKPRQGAVA